MGSWLLPLMASVISLVFAIEVSRQYLRRRRAYQFWWTVSLILYTFAAFAEFLAAFRGSWSPSLYTLYYISAAALVGFMGGGTVFLIGGRRVGHVFILVMAAATVAMAAVAASVGVNTAALAGGRVVAGQAMPNTVRLLAMLLTIPGSLALFGGAAYSWWKTRHHFNLLIALGTLIISGAGGAARLGRPEFLYLGEMLGLAVLFAGFLLSREVPRRS